MKVLFATTNPAKVASYKEKLEQEGIELLTLNDIDINIEVDETGKNAIENAYIKAKTYGDATGTITIGMDNNLFIEGIPEDKQPGTHVRRINGKTLSDDEMIVHYTSLIRQYGGNLVATWVYGMVVYYQKDFKEYTWSKDKFHLVDTPCKNRNIGYPLDSITIIPESNKYLAELTKDKNKDRKLYNGDNVVQFILESVNYFNKKISVSN